MVLEKIVSQVLEKAIGEYVEGFVPGNVNLSLFHSTSGIGYFVRTVCY
jgi:hypothetical protein